MSSGKKHTTGVPIGAKKNSKPAAKPINVHNKVASAGKKASPTVFAPSSNTPNTINHAMQTYLASLGNSASSVFYGVGDRINDFGTGVGNSITNTTRTWGQSVADVGNGIKDSVGVGGPRSATAGNPLGLAGKGSGSIGKTL
ncbi:hypothetical protein K470DRAFT_260553 [Piedraia hortae CBS 480.64]|uniref:Uncharacterized protein n=1 Tax=Piedraia hortae CBS 480.64 TaxID=1314780 RepID=A0A6A7BQZ9_9PEZI|nr:hypothetical protein K470DRAFT_260553 [Piedraia hortae CBS 480.64]